MRLPVTSIGIVPLGKTVSLVANALARLATTLLSMVMRFPSGQGRFATGREHRVDMLPGNVVHEWFPRSRPADWQSASRSYVSRGNRNPCRAALSDKRRAQYIPPVFSPVAAGFSDATD